jgi:hypothetical protein
MIAPENVHPAARQLLTWFEHEHLPPHLQAVSKPFHDLAWGMVIDMALEGPEATTGLRKLLEAKDCAVRAALDKRAAGAIAAH